MKRSQDKFTVKISYNPSKDNNTNILDKVNFLCVDKKIHIRLRDYDHEEVIHGFINKLTYIITYLFQRNALMMDSTNKEIKKFMDSDDALLCLEDAVNTLFKNPIRYLDFTGFNIKPNYRKIKKDVPTPLGSFSYGTCPLKNGCTYSDLNFLIDFFKLDSLEEFLTNDALELIICKDVQIKSYDKFVKKENIKILNKNELKYIPLI